MPDTDELEQRDDAQWELVFVIEGISIAWCSHRYLETLDPGDGRTMRRGLERSGMRRRLEVDMREGPLVPHTMRVKIQDAVGDLAELFSGDRDDFEYLDLGIDAGEDLAARTDLHDMHVGTELIGSSGERRTYPVPLGDTLGREHYAGTIDSQLGAVPTRVSELPLEWVGRRCALYRVYRDHITEPGDYSAGWRPVAEWRRIWWGVMRDDGEVRGREWVLECDGPRSWLQKDLGLSTQSAPVSVSATFDYGADEAEAAGWVGHLFGNSYSDYGSQSFSTVFTGDTVDELRSEFNAFVDALAADGSGVGAWNSYNGNVLGTTGGGRSVVFAHSSDAPTSDSAYLAIVMHYRMWERLGWSLAQAESAPDFGYNFTGEIPSFIVDETGEAPADGYVTLRVILLARDVPPVEVSPRFSGGVAPLDPVRIASEGQPLNLSQLQAGEVTHKGQLFAPVASDPADDTIGYDLPDGPECDRQGMLWLEGERRFAGQEDPFDENALLQCSWADQQGTVLNNQVVATRMWDPRFAGSNRPMLSSTWSQQPGGIRARPVLYLGYQQANGYDLAHIVAQRMLLTTGTSTGWSGFAAEAPISIDPGDNDPPILAGFVRLDTETADLGLAIPRDMVQGPLEWQTAMQTADEEALEVFCAIEPGVNSEDVLDGLLRPLGMAWSLAGGQYGVFTPHDPIQESEIAWVLTRSVQDSDFSGQMREPNQDQREFAPVDKFEVEWSAVVHSGGDFRYSATVDAADAGRRYRPGGISEQISAPFHRRRTLGVSRRQSERAQFWAKRHYTVRGFGVLPSIGRRMWPGEGARITHPLLVDAVASTYGVTARRARILAVEEDFDRDKGGVSVDFLAYAERTTTPRVHGPSARGRGFDSDDDTIHVYDDWLGLGNGWSDVAALVEPEYVGLDAFGGDLDIAWIQWDGTGWSATGSGTVESVDTTPGASTITLSSITGTYYPCQDAIIYAAGDGAQTAAYALALFVAIGDETGDTASGQNQRFEDV